MKIVHVTTYIFPDIMGGAERLVRGIARAQAAAGHDVTVLSANQWNLPDDERRDGFHLIRYPVGRAHGLRFYLDVSRHVRAALHELADRRFDILHAHQITSAVPALSADFPARKVLSFYASYRLEFEAEQLDGAPSGADHRLPLRLHPKSVAIGMLDRRCLQKAERIVAHSHFVLDQIERLAPNVRDRVRIIRPGVDFKEFSPGNQVAARQEFNLPLDRPVIVTVRRLTRRMGLDSLLHAVQRIEAGGIRVVVAIGGEGPERGVLEALCHELRLDHCVRFLGSVPDERLPQLLRAADLFVLPSRSMEGFGMVTIEALACGTPVVATNIGAIPEVLASLDLGPLAPPDPEALADTIRRLLADPDRRLDLAARGLQAVRSRYSWNACIAELDDVYEELCGSAVPA